jgi:hypothetical protein
MDGLKGIYAKEGKDVNANVPNGQFFPSSEKDGLKGRYAKEEKGVNMGCESGNYKNKEHRKVNGENRRAAEDSNIIGMNMGINGNTLSIHEERPAKGRMEECMEGLRNTSLNSNGGVVSGLNNEAVKLKQDTWNAINTSDAGGGNAIAKGRIANEPIGPAGPTAGGGGRRWKKQAREVGRNDGPAVGLNSVTGKRGGTCNYGGVEEYQLNKKGKGEEKYGELGSLSQAVAAEQPRQQQ